MEILTALISLAAGLIGALFGVYATRASTKQAHQNNLILREEARKVAVNRVLQGLRAELETVWTIYNDKFSDGIKSLKEGGIVEREYPLYLHQGYFVVYDTNCSLIGQLPDDELRIAIVTGYLKARELIDAYLHNNQLLKNRADLISQKSKTTSNIFDEDIEAAEKALREHAHYIGRVHNKVEEYYKTAKGRLYVC
jgi:hypothetical protein